MTFEDDQGAYDQKDAAGFIKLNALRLRTLAMRKRKAKKLKPPRQAEVRSPGRRVARVQSEI